MTARIFNVLDEQRAQGNSWASARGKPFIDTDGKIRRPVAMCNSHFYQYPTASRVKWCLHLGRQPGYDDCVSCPYVHHTYDACVRTPQKFRLKVVR